MLAVVGTVPNQDFPLVQWGRFVLEGDFRCRIGGHTTGSGKPGDPGPS